MSSCKVWGPKRSVGLPRLLWVQPAASPLGQNCRPPMPLPARYQFTVKPWILLSPCEMQTVVVHEAMSEFPPTAPFQGSRAGLCVTSRKPLASAQLEERWGLAGGPLILGTGGDHDPGPWPGCVCPTSIINMASSLEADSWPKFRAVCLGVTPLASIWCTTPVPLSTSHLDPAQGSRRRCDAGGCAQTAGCRIKA